MSGGSPSLVKDSLDHVFRILDDPIEDSEKVLVQMAKVLLSLSQGNNQLMEYELSELHDMSLPLRNSLSSPQSAIRVCSDPRESAIVSFALAFSLLLNKESGGSSNLMVNGSDGVKQEHDPSVSGEEGREEERREGECLPAQEDQLTSTRQIKQEPTEEDMKLEGEVFSFNGNLSPPYVPDDDPFMGSNSPIHRDDDFVVAPKSPSSINIEKKRMEIMKRRLIESQWEMDQWPSSFDSDPLMFTDDSHANSSQEEVFVPRSPSLIKKEPERMEIMKRRMIESQWEMDGWPITRRDFKVEDPEGPETISLWNTANNNVVAPSPPSNSSSIFFRCPLSAMGTCYEKWSTKEECYYHVQLCHPDLSLPFACKECTLSFIYKHELREHHEVRHSRPFAIRSSLYLHKLYFPKNAICPHCPFSSQSSRIFLTHHSAEHPSCPLPHISCSDVGCRHRFKFLTINQVIYHYGVVGKCKGQCVLIKK